MRSLTQETKAPIIPTFRSKLTITSSTLAVNDRYQNMRSEDRKKALLQDVNLFRPGMKGESHYGSVHGENLFQIFATKQEASKAQIHRNIRSGIAWSKNGAESITLSGKYEDDTDNGDVILYTGTGGQEELSAREKAQGQIPRQIHNQTFNHNHNAALKRNKETGTPVRVLRGANKHSQHAPAEGYRYDGCYLVETAEVVTGRSGFDICRFKLKRQIDPTHPSTIPIDSRLINQVVPSQANVTSNTIILNTSSAPSRVAPTLRLGGSSAKAGSSGPSTITHDATTTLHQDHEDSNPSTAIDAGVTVDQPPPPHSPSPTSPPTSAHPSPTTETFSPDVMQVRNTLLGPGEGTTSTGTDTDVLSESLARRSRASSVSFDSDTRGVRSTATTAGRGRTSMTSKSRSVSRPRSVTRPFVLDTSDQRVPETGLFNSAVGDLEDEDSEILPVGEGMSIRRFSESKGKNRDDGKGHKRMKSD